ncbi:IS66 family insertion sequence element accessory protein TnpA [Bacteroides reticulotermitis]|uniref:IS66 family insertion sequence element accessory protein TnpA n=1 Tax=Bacteroides reticulotermitis TaxID=1133319 RepID=UPI000695B7D7
MKYQTIEQFRELYNEWKSSRLTVRSFCRNMGINESRFYYWKKKIEAPIETASGSFIPIQMNQVGMERYRYAVRNQARVWDPPPLPPRMSAKLFTAMASS